MEDEARRRYVALTAIRYLGTGVVAPVIIVLLRARGMDVATVGLLYTLHAAVVGVLELPTSGAADRYGARPVLLVAAGAQCAGLLALGLGSNAVVLGAGSTVMGIARALASGPLEAWYVNRVRAADPHADITHGLAAGVRAEGVALGLGTLTGGFLPILVAPWFDSTGSGVIALSVPFLLGAAIAVVELVGLAMGLRTRGGGLPHADPDAARARAGSIRAGLRVVRDHAIVRRILLRIGLAGVVFTSLEILVPVRIAELLGSEDRAAAVYGPLAMCAYLGAGLTAGLAVRVRARAGSPVRGARLLTLAAGIVGLLLGLPPLATLVVGFLGAQLLAGPAKPLMSTVLHDRIDANGRTVMVSILSLAAFVGSAIGGIAVPAVAHAASTRVALAAAAALLAMSAFVLRDDATVAADGDDAGA